MCRLVGAQNVFSKNCNFAKFNSFRIKITSKNSQHKICRFFQFFPAIFWQTNQWKELFKLNVLFITPAP